MNSLYDFLGPDPSEEEKLQALIPLAYRDITLIPEDAWKIAMRRRDLILPLVENPSSSSIKTISETHGVHERTLRRWLRTYLKSGQRVESLFDQSLLGVQANSPLDPIANRIIAEELERWVKDVNRPPKTDVVLTVRGRCRQAGVPEPSPATIYRRIAAIPVAEVTRGQLGHRAWERTFGQSVGDAPRGLCPLDIVEGDHALSDLEVLSESRMHVLGRPWVTALIDAYSACVLALVVQMDRPGLGEVGYAIGMAVLPKTPILLRFDLDLPWPCQGLFSRLHVDNAWELSKSMSLIRALGFYRIDHQSRLAGKPETGSHIERFFKELQQEMHRLPGTTFSNPESRGDYPSEAKAAFTFSEFERYLFRWVLGTYHRRPSSALDGLTPLQQWQAGVEGTESTPGMGEPPMPADPQRFFLDFLPMVERQVEPEGVRVRNLWYQSDDLKGLVGLQDSQHLHSALKVMVRTDPVDLSRVFVLDPRTQNYLVVPMRTLGRPAISLRELNVINRSIRERLHCPVTEELIFREREHLRSLAESAAKLTKKTKVLHQRTRRLLHQTPSLHTDRLPQPSPAPTPMQSVDPATHGPEGPELEICPEPSPNDWPKDFDPREEDL